MKSVALKARLRGENEKGTRACRKLRGQGEIPANLFGAKKTDGKTQLSNFDLAVSAYDVMQLIANHNNVVQVDMPGRRELALIKEVQRDVFGDDVLHVDMEMIDATETIQVTLELVFKGDAKGVKEGGRLQIDLHELEIEALPMAVPENVVVRIDDLAVGQMLHVSELVLPEGVKAVSPPEQSVVQVVAAAEEAEAEEEETEAGTAEPEVISKGKGEESSD